MIILFFYFIPSKENFSDESYKGVICLIIDDFGYNDNKITKEFLAMHPDFSIAIIPGLKYSTFISSLSFISSAGVMGVFFNNLLILFFLPNNIEGK